MKFIKDQEWVLECLHESHVRIIDCRFSLAEPEKGKQEYLQGHIPGAVFFDLEKTCQVRNKPMAAGIQCLC